jgi:ketosteroid isomerase-like protein
MQRNAGRTHKEGLGMTPTTEQNKQLVIDYLEAFTSFDAERYERYLAPDPSYQVGMTVHKGREGFAEVAHYGRVLYPHGHEGHTVRCITAEGDWVSVLMTVDATTNKGVSYRNDYGLFFEFEDGLIKTQVEILDFRVAANAFDLSALV